MDADSAGADTAVDIFGLPSPLTKKRLLPAPVRLFKARKVPTGNGMGGAGDDSAVGGRCDNHPDRGNLPAGLSAGGSVSRMERRHSCEERELACAPPL